MSQPTRPKALPAESSILLPTEIPLPSLPVRDPYGRLQHRYEASQRMLVRIQEEARIKSECLRIAMETLAGYANVAADAPGYTLAQINERLAQLEPEEGEG